MSLVWARRFAAQEADAEDIAQEALLRAWRGSSRLRERESFEGWLAVIVRNEAARAAAKRVPEPVDHELYELSEEDEEVLAAFDRAAFSGLLSALDEHERRLLRLRYVDDMTQPAIAQQLGLPEGTVKVRLHRARAKLREALEP